MMDITKLLNEHGEWWLPSSPGNKLRGAIKKNDSYYILELTDNLCAEISRNITKFEIVNGVVNRHEFTLISVVLNKVSEKFSFIFVHCFIGYHFYKLEDIKFVSINFSLGKILNNWLASSWPDPKFENNKFRLEYKLPESIILSLDNSQITVKFDFGYKYNITSTAVIYETLSSISLSPLENTTLGFEQLLSYSEWLAQFLSICCWQPVKSNSINYTLNNGQDRISYFSSEIYCSKSNESPFIIMPYRAIEENFAGILDDWFLNREKLFVISYIMAKLTDSEYGVPNEMKFTQAIQAVEVFHRRFHSLSELEKDRAGILKEYLDFFNSLFKYENVDSSMKDLVHNKLIHLHEATLRDRIESLIKLIPAEILSQTIISKIDYPERVSELRNLYTHWGEKNNYPNSQETFDYTESLRLLLMISIFKQLNISDVIIVKYIHPNNRFQRTLLNRPT